MENNISPVQYSASVVHCLALGKLAQEEQHSGIPGTSSAKACFELPGVSLCQCCRDVTRGLAFVAALLGGELGAQFCHSAFLPEHLLCL